jgi:hypothetical protein
MPFLRACIVFLLGAAVGMGAEVRTLAGMTLTGDIVKLSEKEVVVKTAEGEVATPITQVLTIDLGPANNLLPANAKYRDVELMDGTVLHCGDVQFKGKEVKLTTVAGQEVKAPLAALRYYIGDAHDAKIMQSVRERFLTKRRTHDILIAKTADGQLNGLEGTLGDADDKGETIEFELTGSGKKVQLALTRVQGMVFSRTIRGDLPEAVCKLTDNHKNTVVASGLALTPTGLTVTTPYGAKIDYTTSMVARLDFSTGKLTFLSDLEPSKVVETNNLDRVEHYRKDQNLDGEKIRLGGEKYDKGLSLHAYTELEYKLDGEYEFFQAVIGVDDLVGGADGHTIVRLEGDGKEITSWKIARKDNPLKVKVPIKDVHRLKVVVASGDLLDLGKHVTLADAKVSK